MADIPKLLELSKRIARKARALIPRSANRAVHHDSGYFVDGRAVSSIGSTAQTPQYVALQLLAQRAPSSQNALRRQVDSLVPDVRLHAPEIEEQRNAAFRKQLAELNMKLMDVTDRLKKDSRLAKKQRKDGTPMVPLELMESLAKNAVRYRVGNCAENSALAFVMFAEYPGPENDNSLPELEGDPSKNPPIERVDSPDGDHAFVVVNRNPSFAISDVARWADHQVIICDPWWFHEGEAFVATDRSGEKDRLMQYITQYAENLRVAATARLGEGHSQRFATRYDGVNFYSNAVDVTTQQLRQ
jgi:hypothetical protein